MKIMVKVVFFSAITIAASAQAESCKLHYILKSGSNGVQGGYSSYSACMKAGNGSASFSNKIESFYCECKK
ncbi:MAG: hypothetical protein HOD58_13075 [Gammaproteobacteria bacterium]|jgi:hypothetical protein|nr:hypothetical protein [Gammaproteobacteria bacterium]MBT7831968.1 hypothetical protein [Candidatus Neomarinimicrobiota bacterium]MBT4330845.1 hypothetical protein [Gammaproteobacteria bacterium]MBT5634787.1 hypothetical protein [Gammaproteobacteria bacterium]MBT5746455.1 hypothetical protein [Gammaproteobacteria bacterium]